MKHVSMHEAKTHLSRLVKEALEGEKIVITNRNAPQVVLVPYAEDPKRRIGGIQQFVNFIADDFDEPLDDFEDYA